VLNWRGYLLFSAVIVFLFFEANKAYINWVKIGRFFNGVFIVLAICFAFWFFFIFNISKHVKNQSLDKFYFDPRIPD